MLRRCLRICCDDTPEDASGDSHLAPRSNRMIRIFQSTDRRNTTTYRGDELGENDDGEDDDCCRTNEVSEGTSSATTAATSRRMSDNNNNAPASGLLQFWRTIREKLNLDTTEGNDSTNPETRQQQRDETIPILKSEAKAGS